MNIVKKFCILLFSIILISFSCSVTAKMDPNMDDEFFNLLSKNDTDNMIEYITKLEKTDPNGYKHHYYTGVMAASNMEFDYANQFYDAALSKAPNNPYIYEYKALSYIDSKEYDKAIQNATKAAKLVPNERNPYILRMLALMHKGDYGAAGVDIDIILKLPIRNEDLLKQDNIIQYQLLISPETKSFMQLLNNKH